MSFVVRKIGALFMIIGMLSALAGCSSETETLGEYKTITPEAALELMAEEPSVFLVDVREQSEYDGGHIAGSILLPLGTIESSAEAMFPDYNQTLVVYCRSGNRSKTAVNALLALGYKDVYDLGGIIDWPYEVFVD